MATITVTTGNDTVDANDGETSLREALTLANDSAGADKIIFDKALAGSTIELQGELVLSSDVSINGDTNKDGDADITISGGGTTRLVTVQAGVTAALTSLYLTGGDENVDGDVIQNNGTLTLSYSVISGNGATATFETGSYNPTGTILNAGQLQIIQTAFSGNTAAGGNGGDGNGSSGDGEHAAGAVLNLYGATLTLDQVAISGGTAIGGNAGSAGGSYGGWAALGVLNLGTMSGTADNDSTGGIVTAGTGNSSSFNGQSSLTNLNYSGSFINGTGAITQVALGTMGADVEVVLQNQSFAGLGGSDTITGNTYSSISGGAGSDTLTGGLGVTASGGLGDDTLNCTFTNYSTFSGGAGRDTINFSSDNLNGQTIDLSAASFGFFNSTFRGFENVIASDGAETIIGGKGANVVFAFDGDDTVSGGGGADALVGGRGSDILQGDGGDDILDGGAKVDILTGGSGRDIFALAKQAASADTVIGFVSGKDSIEISNFDFETGLPLGDLAPDRFRINTTGSAGDGNDRFIFNANTGELTFDSNGSASGGARIIATFTGGAQVAASDFEIV